MRTRTANWYLAKVRYEKMTDDGLEKKVTEQFVVDAMSWAEAEANITENLAPYISGEFEIVDISKAPFTEVFFTEDTTDDCWMKAKVMFITLDDKSGREKKTKVTYLVQGKDIASAIKTVEDVMKQGMSEFKSVDMSETKIMDVFESCIN